mgnify:CR=1 FL=1
MYQLRFSLLLLLPLWHIALTGQCCEVLPQCVGALQFFVAKQEALDAVGNLIDQIRLGHVGCILRATQACTLKSVPVGARGVVHTPQFNGNQEEWLAPSPLQPELPPQRSSGQALWASLLSRKPLNTLNKCLGRRQRLSPPARIPANKVVLRFERGTKRSSTVGEGGESTVLWIS